MNDIDLEINTLAAISSGKIIGALLNSEKKHLDEEINKKQKAIADFDERISRTRGAISQQKVAEATEISDNLATKRRNHDIRLWRKEEIFSIIECVAFNVLMVLVLLRVVYHDYGTLSPAGNTEIKWVYIICSIAMAGFTALIWFVRYKVSDNYGTFGSIKKETIGPKRESAFTVEGMEKNLNQQIQTKKQMEQKANEDIETYKVQIDKNRKVLYAFNNYLKNKYSAILPFEEFTYADLLLHYIKTKRADNIKEALRLLDERKNNKEQFEEEWKLAVQKMKGDIYLVKTAGDGAIKEFMSVNHDISKVDLIPLINKWNQFWVNGKI